MEDLKNDRYSVRWNDGTYDWERSCSACHAPDCTNAVHKERYDEVVTKKTYWDYMYEKQPLGGFKTPLGETHVTEYYTSNPSNLPLLDSEHTSGLSERVYDLAQEAFNQLTQKQQEVWTLVMREQVSLTEAAKRLRITVQAVDKRLNQAKASYTNYLRSKEDAGFEGVSGL